MSTWPLFLPCPRGLESLLLQEVSRIFPEQNKAETPIHKQVPGGVLTRGDARTVMALNLWSRLASRVLLQVAHGPYRDEASLYALARSVAWHDWLGPQHTLRVDLSAQHSPLRSLQFATLKVKDAVCDVLRDRRGARPNIDTQQPDVRVYAHLSRDEAWLYLDTSGEPLFKRGWRLNKGEAPIKENLAAGMVQLCGWDTESALIDPFCGSGTLLIEAAHYAMQRAPGLLRGFGFERLPGFDPQLLTQLRRDAQERIVPLRAPLLGSDTDPAMCDIARANAAHAGVSADKGSITWQCADAVQALPTAPQGWVLSNPPYGERMHASDELFTRLGTQLKQQFRGWQVWLISADPTLPKQLGLQPKRKVPLFNGPIETRLFGFDLVQGSYRPRATQPTPAAT